ncbi:TetR/AcrR family transcriptional regulator [Agrococcus sp. UYP10]|uniref:TetR/AcrR family transcriptional regulator n=1 Tax=Agrococcus sp. UYP10 TaxID=1756355 RepID=UPI0033958E6E
MTSSTAQRRSRKRPEERREEILAAAASIAIDEGLERITLRAVAERLGVRPGLITHYFPAAEDLVVEGFARAAIIERERFFPAEGDALRRLAHLIGYIESGASLPLARLWLNARHLSRFSPTLNRTLDEQDLLDRARLTQLVTDGIAAGEFAETDAEAASVRIWIAIDGRGSSVNSAIEEEHPASATFASDVAEWALALPPGTLRRAIDDARGE